MTRSDNIPENPEPGQTTLPQYRPVLTATFQSPSQTPEATLISSKDIPENVEVFPHTEGYFWRLVVDGLEAPIGIANAQDGSGRIFVIEQPGRIRIVRDEQLRAQPFLDITDRVGSQGSEQGLLGLAFHPDYVQNGFFYVNYTDINGNTVIARFQVSRSNIDLADPTSESRLLSVDQPYQNHNGGGLVFGPDGYLYIGLGDGGSAGDPQNNAQSLNSLLGKILRVNIDTNEGYTIPSDNPFMQGDGLPEIWAYGLRNPWRFSFDRLSGDLYIGDVGQNHWEEIDFLPAGKPGWVNFGWRFKEGNHPYQGSAPAEIELIAPVTEYSHDLGCSVTGGVVYRGEQLPEWQGIYLFGDYCSQRVWGLLRDSQGSWKSVILFEGIGSITSFGEDEAGEVYLVTHSGQLQVLSRK